MKHNYDLERIKPHMRKAALRGRLGDYWEARGITELEHSAAIRWLDRYADKMTGSCYPSYKELAKSIGTSERTAFRLVERLAEIGALAIVRPTSERNADVAPPKDEYLVRSRLDWNLDWMPPVAEEPVLSPIAQRVSEYDAAYPDMPSRQVAAALGTSFQTVQRARKKARSVRSMQVHGSGTGKSSGTKIPTLIFEISGMMCEKSPLIHPLIHPSDPSGVSSPPMDQHEALGNTYKSASATTAKFQGTTAKKAGTTDSTVAVQSLEEPRAPSARSGGGSNSVALRAPDGALATNEVLAAKFEELRGLWMAKPQGVNVTAALTAYRRICKDHGDEIYAEQGVNICDHLLAQANIWVTKIHDVQMLPKLERWLEDYAWRNGPPDRKPARGSKASYVEIANRRGAARRA
jgi:hypothetical protein